MHNHVFSQCTKATHGCRGRNGLRPAGHPPTTPQHRARLENCDVMSCSTRLCCEEEARTKKITREPVGPTTTRIPQRPQRSSACLGSTPSPVAAHAAGTAPAAAAPASAGAGAAASVPPFPSSAPPPGITGSGADALWEIAAASALSAPAAAASAGSSCRDLSALAAGSCAISSAFASPVAPAEAPSAAAPSAAAALPSEVFAAESGKYSADTASSLDRSAVASTSPMSADTLRRAFWAEVCICSSTTTSSLQR